MHKRETFKIVLITLGVLAVIVINAIIFTEDEPDILAIPQTTKATNASSRFLCLHQCQREKGSVF